MRVPFVPFSPKCYPSFLRNICNIFARYMAYVTFQSSKTPCFIGFIWRSFSKVTLSHFCTSRYIYYMLHLSFQTEHVRNASGVSDLSEIEALASAPHFSFLTLTERAKFDILKSIKEPLWGLNHGSSRPCGGTTIITKHTSLRLLKINVGEVRYALLLL